MVGLKPKMRLLFPVASIILLRASPMMTKEWRYRVTFAWSPPLGAGKKHLGEPLITIEKWATETKSLI